MKVPDSLETPVEPSAAPPPVAIYPPTPVSWRLAIAAAILVVAGVAYWQRESIGLRGQSAAGVLFFFGIVAVFSTNLRAVNWRTIRWGVTLQLILAILVLTHDGPYETFPTDLLATVRSWLIGHVYSIVASICFAAMVIAWLVSYMRPVMRGEPVAWTGVMTGLAALVVAALIFFVVGVRQSFEHTGDLVKAFIGFSDKGAEFVFGNLAHPEHLSSVFGKDFLFPFAFKALPPILFVSAFFTVLYHFGILQIAVRLLARVMVHLMRTSGAETLSVAANVFMGQTEAPLIVKPYVPRMTNSELFALMASGMAHISGGMMAVYINYGANPVAVLTTCVMACPCSLYLSKLFLPEISKPETGGMVHTEQVKSPYVNAVDAAASGTSDGLRLALNVGAMLIVFIAFVAMFDGILSLISTARLNSALGWDLPEHISLQWIFGQLFSPIAFLMGVDHADQSKVGTLLGCKLAINEHYAYLQMKAWKAIPDFMTERSYQLAAYALTGFANFSSVGIQLGGIGAMAPDRRHDLARLGMRALFVGFTATLLNASMAGMFLENVVPAVPH